MYYITQNHKNIKTVWKKQQHTHQNNQATNQATKHNHVPRDIPGFEWRGQLW